MAHAWWGFSVDGVHIPALDINPTSISEKERLILEMLLKAVPGSGKVGSNVNLSMSHEDIPTAYRYY
jgi:hypothetical protein